MYRKEFTTKRTALATTINTTNNLQATTKNTANNLQAKLFEYLNFKLQWVNISMKIVNYFRQ